MKKIILSVACLAVAICITVAVGCKKKNNDPAPSTTCSTCASTPDAKAANDNSSHGIYKGIIVVSSGTIKFDIMNTDSSIKAYMVIDGESITLTSSGLTGTGTATAIFNGTMNAGPVSITLTVNENGGSPTITALSIPGHPNATLTIIKETSTNLVKCYEGTYTNATSGKNGTFDLTLSTAQKVWIAQTREEGATQSGQVGGTVDGNTIKFDDGAGASGTATLTDQKISDGTWKNTRVPENGTWKATRTL
jgi:hypothetical protein